MLLTAGSLLRLNTMWIFAQSPFKSVLLGRHTSSPIPESLCLEFVAPPSHSAHRPQGGLRQSTAFFGTQTPPVGQPPARVWFQQLDAPQTTFVHVRVPLAHVHVLQSSCMSVLCRWRMTPPGRRQCLQSCSSSGRKSVIVLDASFAIRFVRYPHDTLFLSGDLKFDAVARFAQTRCPNVRSRWSKQRANRHLTWNRVYY